MLLLISACGGGEPAPFETEVVDEVRQRVEAFGQAFVRADADALAEMPTDDYAGRRFMIQE